MVHASSRCRCRCIDVYLPGCTTRILVRHRSPCASIWYVPHGRCTTGPICSIGRYSCCSHHIPERRAGRHRDGNDILWSVSVLGSVCQGTPSYSTPEVLLDSVDRGPGLN